MSVTETVNATAAAFTWFASSSVAVASSGSPPEWLAAITSAATSRAA
jgi:hypothetical protein